LRDYLPASLVPETKDRAVVGLVKGEIYMRESDIFQAGYHYDSKQIHFFSANRFSPSKTINLERNL